MEVLGAKLIQLWLQGVDGYGTFGEANAKSQGSSSKCEAKQSELYSAWDFATATVADFATVPFLLMQIPQIILNTQNLLSGSDAALFAVEWTVCNSSLFSYTLSGIFVSFSFLYSSLEKLKSTYILMFFKILDVLSMYPYWTQLTYLNLYIWRIRTCFLLIAQKTRAACKN